MSGYAFFHRSLIGHPAFRNDAEAMAFAYMVLRAAWRPVRVRYKGKALSLNRGQLAMSVRDLAEAMDRDKGWVERLLRRLKSETMCETRAETGVLVITICNYEKYQSSSDERETVNKTPDETPARQAQDTEQVREEYKKEDKNPPSPQGGRSALDFLIFEAVLSAIVAGCEHILANTLTAEHVLDAWNDLASRYNLPKAKMNPRRRRAIEARIRQHALQDFTEAIGCIARNPWMHGDNDKGWRADFDFFLQPKSFTKLTEGSYDRASQTH